MRGSRVAVLSFTLLLVSRAGAAEPEVAGGPYAKWSHGPSADPNFFPIGVWLQNPARAQRYREAGFNLYIALWRGPTEEQLAQLRQAGMRVICHQNAIALQHIDDPTIAGWMHGDEPDNAQSLGQGKGYGPPIPPAKIVADYERVRSADPSRPVMLNLGQGVAWDGWYGRGVRSRHPEDYPEYVQGCDIVSFDIYPVTHSSPEVAGQLWYVARGVERLGNWTQGRQVVWNCIECTHVQNAEHKPTPAQVRSEVWMALIHGSMGLIYFVHEWEPKFDESALLSDPVMYAAVTQVNRQIGALAPVLNRPTVAGAATAISLDSPVALMMKRYGGAVYLFTVALREAPTRAQFTLRGLTGQRRVEVLGEDRTLEAKEGVFADEFQSWDVHLYRIAAEAKP
jgi:hypothetical protein